jgi:hypothetical protein
MLTVVDSLAAHHGWSGGGRPSAGLECVYCCDDLLPEWGESLLRVLGGPYQDGSAEVPLDK